MGLPSEQQSEYINDGETYNGNGIIVDDYTSLGSHVPQPISKDQYISVNTRNEAAPRQIIDDDSSEQDDCNDATSEETSEEDISRFNA